MSTITLSTTTADCWGSPVSGDLWDALTYAYIGGSTEDTDAVRVWIPFTVNLPRITISTATLKIIASASGSDAVNIAFLCEDVDNASAPANQAALAAKALTTARLNVSPPAAYTAGVEYTYDITTAVQEVLDRAGWVLGNTLAVMIITNAASSTLRREIAMSEHATYTEPKLEITYFSDIPKASGMM